MSISNDPVQITKSALTRIIGNNIYQYRIELGITQEELAEKVGIGASFIARIESGQKIMSVLVLYKIARALHVSSDMLFSEIPDATRQEKISKIVSSCPADLIENAEKVLRICLAIIEA
ncbi:MAG: helix-turn-helix transcriptional regulator [Lachnospiraceae bacterium]|nr:helix-turn-helix transcriptional regulator [Lachnospiraceae bacterium]